MGKTLGVKTTIGFNGGKTNEKEILSFAKTFEGNGLTSVSSFSKSWNQLNLLVGPSILIGKKGRLELNLQGGLGYILGFNNLKIDLYDATTFTKNVYNVESKSILPMWNLGGSYYVNKLSKNFAMKINGQFGSNGGTIGIAFSDLRGCYTCLCCRICPPGCPSTQTKGNK